MTTSPNGHRPGAAAPEQSSNAKQFANLQARATLSGVTVHQLGNGNFLCCRWGLSRELDTLARVEAWLDLTIGSRA